MEKAEIIKLLRETGCSEDVIEHCRSVASLAQTIARHIPECDEQKACSGGLIHDIGRSATHGIMHAVEGARIASELGLDPYLIGIIRNHIGAGITREETRALGLPEEDFIPETIEEKVVAHADNLISGTKRRTLEQLLKKLDKRGMSPQIKARFKALHEELSNRAGMDIDLL